MPFEERDGSHFGAPHAVVPVRIDDPVFVQRDVEGLRRVHVPDSVEHLRADHIHCIDEERRLRLGDARAGRRVARRCATPVGKAARDGVLVHRGHDGEIGVEVLDEERAVPELVRGGLDCRRVPVGHGRYALRLGRPRDDARLRRGRDAVIGGKLQDERSQRPRFAVNVVEVDRMPEKGARLGRVGIQDALGMRIDAGDEREDAAIRVRIADSHVEHLVDPHRKDVLLHVRSRGCVDPKERRLIRFRTQEQDLRGKRLVKLGPRVQELPSVALQHLRPEHGAVANVDPEELLNARTRSRQEHDDLREAKVVTRLLGDAPLAVCSLGEEVAQRPLDVKQASQLVQGLHLRFHPTLEGERVYVCVFQCDGRRRHHHELGVQNRGQGFFAPPRRLPLVQHDQRAVGELEQQLQPKLPVLLEDERPKGLERCIGLHVYGIAEDRAQLLLEDALRHAGLGVDGAHL
mmetsp:Transcript_19433/g.73423  ORF Transcript_19433/g.73423 Transcript_19433/m.73423 type:complete len:461 (-) Transcript_19433:1160-2542(-)